jgi:hypothetical protein
MPVEQNEALQMPPNYKLWNRVKVALWMFLPLILLVLIDVNIKHKDREQSY